MTRRERLMATLRGEAVDRVPVCFYELNGLDEDPDDPNPFNIFSDPSWRPLIELTREKTDRIVLRSVPFGDVLPDAVEGLGKREVFLRDGSEYTIRTVNTANGVLTSRTRRDPHMNTVWTEEHLLKDVRDLEAFLALPEAPLGKCPDPAPVLDAETALGETGIALIDTPDALCLAASLFDMATYTMIALTEQVLFHRLLERFARSLQPKTEAIARELPGRLWRIYGPEYASAPYLPPALFREYVMRYDTPMVEAIQGNGGFARIHSHGRLRGILDDIAGMGAVALDPVEPPPQGDVDLSYVRERYGRQFVLFGNLEISDIESMPTEYFARKVETALAQGTAGEGRGFVLMPSACPLGRELSVLTLKNYETMISMTEAF